MRFPITLLALLIFIGQISTAQVTSQLHEYLKDAAPHAFIPIRIEFSENVDCYALNRQFKDSKTPVSQRAQTVISRLQEQAKASQHHIYKALHTSLATDVRNVHAFWIVNLMVLEARPSAIQALALMEGIAQIDLENSTFVAHDPILKGTRNTARVENGVEPGLVAINAPALWALGYTGRGRLVYNYDTGVWPNHPAFANRFLAKRFPLAQTWTGYFSSIPNGNISNHGTHTLGTIAGLVEATNDTIGVAFSSYWIANDFVTTTVEALPPLAAMIGAFEWALNPDGDPNTIHDIPDVINNSWRWHDDPDTVQCGGFVVNLMNAIEAAGIANVFSGGNAGPNNTTVHAPQRINTSEVNTFSVGSINGNTNFPYPISNFSSIGPTQCPSNGNLALEIHPEVVAPGQNVRSAWGQSGFNTISGTSMAAPHVSGAVLLLKEAFPYLAGEDLLWALYLTAIDLGDAGEDNVYGRGVIDVHAAFTYLSQTHTPVNPNEVAWDLAIELENVEPFTCGNTIAPQAILANLGDSTITAVEISYTVNQGTPQFYSWTGSLLPGNTTIVPLPISVLTDYGHIEVQAEAMLPNQSEVYDLFNNHWNLTFNRREPQGLPFIEGFENGFDHRDWLVENEDGGITWDTITTHGLDWSTYSASVQCYKYSPREGQIDGLISNSLLIPETTFEPVWLLFDVAYQKWANNSTASDTLFVLASTNCGATFNHQLYKKGGENLQSTEDRTPNFSPEVSTDWRRDSINITSFTGQEILLKFQTKNGKGNHLFIDNIKVFVGDTEPASVANLASEIRVYPNPAGNHLTIERANTQQPIENVVLRDALGKTIQVDKLKSTANRIIISISSLKPGIYFVEVASQHQRSFLRFVKQ